MLAILGFFPFITKTVPFQSVSRQSGWRHPTHNAVGGIPPAQYTGPEADTLTISAELRPEITGGDASLADLYAMAETGKPHNLIWGTGEVMGAYVITSIKTEKSQLMHDGKARSINFTMDLQKAADQPMGLKGKALFAAAGLVRRLVGI